MTTASDVPPPPTGNDSAGWLERTAARLEFNRAVAYALLLRGWQLAAGVVSAVLIALYFTPDVQGYYYTFSSLLTLQALFELGCGQVLANLCSHEWAALRLDDRGRVSGDAAALSRLAHLSRLMFKLYGTLLAVFVVTVGFGGAAFLALQPANGVEWRGPWFALVAASGLLLWTMPFNAMLEGCNQVAAVNRFRLIQAVCANVTVWIALVLHADLWVAVFATVVRVAVELSLLLVRYRRFFASLLMQSRVESRESRAGERNAPPTTHQPDVGGRRPDVGGLTSGDQPSDSQLSTLNSQLSTTHHSTFSWKREIWPLQWRLGLQAPFGFLASSLYVPVLWYYQSKAVAGQMGMTWMMLFAVQAAALAWVQARIPQFGVLVARKEYGELDRLFRRLTVISVAAVTLGGLALCAIVVLLNELGVGLAERILPPMETAAFAAAFAVLQWSHCLAVYLRAHKRDPLWTANLLYYSASGVAAWYFASRFGPLAAGLGYLGTILIVNSPLQTAIWVVCRREWHRQ